MAACTGQPLQDILQPDPNLEPAGSEPVGSEIAGSSVASCDSISRSRLPSAYPDSFCYPDAELQQVTETTLDQGSDIEARWSTADDSEQVEAFYRDALVQENWELTTSAADETGDIEAVKDGVQMAIALTASQADAATLFTVSYRPPQTAQPDPPAVSTVPEAGDEATPAPRASQSFTDVDDAPEDLQNYIRDLANLGVLDGADGNAFQPNETVTRRTFARWLFNANNAFYTESAKRIRNATGDSAFQDLSSSNPDFEKIQGLVDAGLIPSALSGESTVVNFRPDAPLTRETLLQWKVPLDLRRSLPNATVEAVKEAWGFQDAAKIEPKALQAVLADHANGNQANIRRAFGFTTLFQPQKPVTRAEAAAALWHFGYQGDGLSADEVRRGDADEADQSESLDE